MNILIIGSGGREHALAWKVAQNHAVKKVFVAPGNAGTQLEPKVANLAIDPSNFEELAFFAESNEVNLTIVGPEQPLVDGIVDFFFRPKSTRFWSKQEGCAARRLKSFC